MAQTARKQNSGTKTSAGSGKKATAKKSSGKASPSRRTSASSKRRKKDEAFLGPEVFVIGAFAVSAFLFLSNFGICGVVGRFFRGILLGLFGLPGYLVPLLLFAAVLYSVSMQGDFVSSLKIGAGFLCLVSVCGIFHMLFGGHLTDLREIYRASAEKALGGGLIGGALSGALEDLAGGVGAFLLFAVLFIIGIVCITERSLVGFLKERSSEAYSQAREDIGRHREEQAVRREERAREKELKRAGRPDMRSVTISPRDAAPRPAAVLPKPSVMPEPVLSKPAVMPEAALPKPEAVPEEIHAEPSAVPAAVSEAALPETVPVFPAASSDAAPVSGTLPAAAEKESAAEESRPDLHTSEMPSDSDLTVNRELLRAIYTSRDTRTLEEITGLTDKREDKLPEIPVNRGDAIKNPPVPKTEFRPEPKPELKPELKPEPEPEEIILFDPEPEPDPEPIPLYREDPEPDIEPETEAEREEDISVPSRRRPAGDRKTASDEDDYDDIPADAIDDPGERTSGGKKTEAASGRIILPPPESGKEPEKEYIFPPIDLLGEGPPDEAGQDDAYYRETALKLQETLRNFGVGVTVTNISCGPTVTQYELHPDQGVKVSRIQGLADDIKLSLAAEQVRIEAPIPGKSAVGIEVPNKENKTVYFRSILESPEFTSHKSRVCFGVGKDIAGRTVVADIAKMPHLLIAGQTGSGKSVCINTLIMSILYKAKPDEVKLIMIDPKIVELSVYNGIPHLLYPVVTDPKKAAGALNWAVSEMTERYQKFADFGVRDLKGYNAKIDSIADVDDPDKPKKMPQIIIIVDELADLMMVAPSEVEDAICRLAQLARAAGLHLVIATQRPSVNVITGIIKANIPSRIAFAVAQSVDSRTIIDMNGAEKLLGKGDMLFYPSGAPKPKRVQGAFITDEEVAEVVRFLKEENLPVTYTKNLDSVISSASAGGGEERDAYFEQAGRFIIEKEKASIGMLQRMFKIGFNRAARIMDQLADAGVVGQEEGTKPRKILMTMEEFEKMLEE